jgi:hypothetical protein
MIFAAAVLCAMASGLASAQDDGNKSPSEKNTHGLKRTPLIAKPDDSGHMQKVQSNIKPCERNPRPIWCEDSEIERGM